MSDTASHPMIVTAHRGASAAAPENTAAAFQRALDVGVDAIETDIRLSQDGVPVLVHDADLMRVAGSRSKVADLTAAELARVDVGGWMAPQFSDQGVPSLAWLADRCRPDIYLLLDLKVEGAAAAIAEVLRAAEFPAAHAYLCAWSADQAADIRRHLPHAHLVYIEEASSHPDTGWVRDAALRGYDSLSLDHTSLDAETITEAHANGLEVFAWTVNDAADIERVRGFGADGVICDGTPAGQFPPGVRGARRGDS